jgi:malate synthase
MPENFVVTLPKVPVPEQVTALVAMLERLESAHGLAKGTMKLELMIELTQSILDREGRSTLPLLLSAARGRCTGAHFGTYDYTASYSITAQHQVMGHPACDFAKHMMKVAYSNTGIFLSDGATTMMPAAPHRGDKLTDAQKAENTRAVHGAWKAAYDNIRHSLI